MAAGVSIRFCMLLEISTFLLLLLDTEGSKDARAVFYQLTEHAADSRPSDHYRLTFRDWEHTLRHRTRRGAADSNNTSSAATTTTTTKSSISLPVTTTPPGPTPATKSPTTTTTTTPKPAPSTTTIAAPEVTSLENVTVLEDTDHKYYLSRVVHGPEADELWVDRATMDRHGEKHDTLSKSHRTAATIKLGFTFLFYGHEIKQVTIATGGFLYMSSFLHQWLTATQYIAPLMANFDTQLGNNSYIHYADNGTAFIVWWEDVYIQDHAQAGPFSFQTILHQDGRVIFNYKNIPVLVKEIPRSQHPVKIGLSDAYYIDKQTTYNVKRRTIYEYHRVEIDMEGVTNKSSVIITPLPTCVTLKSCKQCIETELAFSCQWCGSTARCSDGLDRHRQKWLQEACHQSSIKTRDECLLASLNVSATTASAANVSTLHQVTTKQQRGTISLPRSSGVSPSSTRTTSIPSIKPDVTAPVSTLKLDHVTTLSTPKHDHVTTLSTPKRDHVTTLSTPKRDHVTTLSTPKREHVKTLSTPKREHVTTLSTPKREHVKTLSTPKRDHVTTLSTPKRDPVTTLSTPKHDHVTTLSTAKRDHVTTLSTPTVALSTPKRDHVITPSLPRSSGRQPQTSEGAGTTKRPMATPQLPPHQVTGVASTTSAPPAVERGPTYVTDKCRELKTIEECPTTHGGGGAYTGRNVPGKPSVAGGIPIGGIVAVILVITLIIFITVFTVYGYLRPQSVIGLWMIEHRPSVLRQRLSRVKFWKRRDNNADKYEVSMQPDGESVA